MEEIRYAACEPYWHVHTLTAKGRHFGKSLLDLLTTEFRTYTKAFYQRKIVSGSIQVNASQVTDDYIIRQRDCITFREHRHEVPILPGSISILYSDSKLVVVNKPAGIPVHPTGPYNKNTLLFHLEAHYKQKLFPVFRLDKLTSGVLVFATSSKLVQHYAGLACEKIYYARLKGCLKDAPIKPYVSQDASGRIRVEAPISVLNQRQSKYGVILDENKNKNHAKSAVTDVQVISYNKIDDTTLVQCSLQSGRTHQIRIHMEYCGFPIANDPSYGGNMTNENSLYIGMNVADSTNDDMKKQWIPPRYLPCQDCQSSDRQDGKIAVHESSQQVCSFIYLHSSQYTFLGDTVQVFNAPDPDWVTMRSSE